jgi:hypothetical protein
LRRNNDPCWLSSIVKGAGSGGEEDSQVYRQQQDKCSDEAAPKT